MDPVTHVLASAVLARAAFDKVPRAVPVAIVAGLAVDADWLNVFAGPEAYLRYHRVISHSVVGATGVIVATVAFFALLWRRWPTMPMSSVEVFRVGVFSAILHLFLDLLNPHGVGLQWPRDSRRHAWDLTEIIDPWLLTIMLAGWLLPTLLRLITEEIGAKAERKGPRRWAIATLALVAVYAGVRWHFHGNAVALLDSRMYHGAAPNLVAALPVSPSPLKWRGVVETDNTYEEVEVPAGSGAFFDSDRSLTRYKPEASPALEAALKSGAVQRFLSAARFPLATVEQIAQREGMPTGGFRVTLRDLRFSERSMLVRPVVAIVEMDSAYRVQDERFEFVDPD